MQKIKQIIKDELANVNWLSVLISFGLVVVLVTIDQLTKYLIETKMTYGQQIEIIDNFFWITSHRNTGAAWGVGSGKLTFFIIITIVALLIYLILYKDVNFKKMTIYSLAITCIVGGTLGNFIDRIFKDGKVTDFLDFLIFGYDFPVFNFADMCLVVGVGLLIFDLLFGKTGKQWTK